MNKIMKKWGLPCLASLALCMGFNSCADDDSITVNTSSIKAASDFVDARDGHVYHCIQVGDQIWMTENLAYFLPRGAADGCVTWDEQQDIDPESLEVDTTDITVVITDDKYEEIYNSIVDDPSHDWEMEVGTRPLTFHLWFNNFYGEMFTQQEFTNMIVSDPVMAPFSSLLLEKLEVERANQRQDYINGLIAKAKQIPIDHRDEAEIANGGYVAQNGYLYTYDGAALAVPKEGGWRIPTDADWKKLETAIGMPAGEVDRMNSWRGETLGDALKKGGATGFNALFSGCNAYQRTQEELFIKKDEGAYFWSSDKGSYTVRESMSEEEKEAQDSTQVGNDSIDNSDGKVNVTYETGIIRQLAIYSSSIWRGTTRIENGYRGMAYSVRLVKDATK